MNLTAPAATSGLRSRLALDLRSLALLRAGLAGVLLLDALCRLFAAGLLYSDAGLLPRGLALDALEGARWSLHLANGSLAFALLLAALQALTAAALVVGWHARIAGPLLWVLVVSASARHPAVTSAADALALLLLSLGLFLPWHARWSVDAAFSPQRPAAAFFSWPGLALLASTCALPLWLALGADAPPGPGLRALLSSESAGPLATVLLRAPAALPFIETGLRFAAWLILPLTLLAAIVPLARRVALGLYLLLCLAALLLVSGAVPWLALLAAPPLIDPALWERLARASAPGELRVHPDRTAVGAAGLSLLLREFLCLPRAQVSAAQDSPRAARLIAGGATLVVIDRDEEAHLDGAAVAVLLRRSPLLRPLRVLPAGVVGRALGGALLRLGAAAGPLLSRAGTGSLRQVVPSRGATLLSLPLSLMLALVSLGAAGALPSSVASLARTTLTAFALDRVWLELLPAADADRFWIAVPGETLEGKEVDARSTRLSPPDYRPGRESWLAGEHARQYERALAQPQAGAARLALARYLCAQHPAELARLRVTLMVSVAGTRTPEQRVLLRHECRRGVRSTPTE